MKEIWGQNVTLRDGGLIRRGNANRAYMMRLNRENLLLNYYLEAGLFTAPFLPEGIHGGWESPTCQLRGHFTGHWLSAAALHYYATGDAEVKARADYIVDELEKCQRENGGQWAGSIPEKYLHWIAQGKSVWAPQYALHKTLMGLADMAEYAGSEQALRVAGNFARWFAQWADGFSREAFDDILDYETGGMLEIWAQLYEMTRDDLYPDLMARYYRGRFFDPLLQGQDVLTNMHANTTIPEVIGCARAYDVTGEPRWREIVEAYWEQAVCQRGSYATGGQTCGEIWTPKNELAARLGGKNQEYCTVYNMMRLAGFLFRWTGEARYAEYCELNLYNGIMAQSYWQGNPANGEVWDHPDHGLLTYFLPLAPGSVKNWASETQAFFCCHGTLVQSNAQLGRGIYYQDDDGLYVCQYLDSEASFTVRGQSVSLSQTRDTLAGSFHLESTSDAKQGVSATTTLVPHNPDAHIACFTFHAGDSVTFTLRLRVPEWAEGWQLHLNGERIEPDSIQNGFALLHRVWSKADVLRFVLPMHIVAVPLPDEPAKVAFRYGPVLLAGRCGNEPRLYLKPEQTPADLLAHDNEREWASWKSTFRITGQPNGIQLAPLYEIGYEPYTVYFPTESIT